MFSICFVLCVHWLHWFVHSHFTIDPGRFKLCHLVCHVCEVDTFLQENQSIEVFPYNNCLNLFDEYFFWNYRVIDNLGIHYQWRGGFMSPIVDQLMEDWDDIVTELDDKINGTTQSSTWFSFRAHRWGCSVSYIYGLSRDTVPPSLIPRLLPSYSGEESGNEASAVPPWLRRIDLWTEKGQDAVIMCGQESGGRVW